MVFGDIKLKSSNRKGDWVCWFTSTKKVDCLRKVKNKKGKTVGVQERPFKMNDLIPISPKTAILRKKKKTVKSKKK